MGCAMRGGMLQTGHRRSVPHAFGRRAELPSALLLQAIYAIGLGPLSGKASGIYLLLTRHDAPAVQPGCKTRWPAWCTRDGSTASISMRNPETWWPIDQDYMIDDYMFSNDAHASASGRSRERPHSHPRSNRIQGQGRPATLPAEPPPSSTCRWTGQETAVSLKFEVSLYPMVGALLGATLVRPG